MKKITVKMSDNLYDQLSTYAVKNDAYISQAVRFMIEFSLDKHKTSKPTVDTSAIMLKSIKQMQTTINTEFSTIKGALRILGEQSSLTNVSMKKFLR